MRFDKLSRVPDEQHDAELLWTLADIARLFSLAIRVARTPNAAGGTRVSGALITVCGAIVKVDRAAKVAGNPTFDCNPKDVSGWANEAELPTQDVVSGTDAVPNVEKEFIDAVGANSVATTRDESKRAEAGIVRVDTPCD